MAIKFDSFAHIAPGPYKFLGVTTEEERLLDIAARNANAIGAEVVITNTCAGSCAHCGTEIWDVYWFRGSNGLKFKVGCDCAEKALTGEEDRPVLNKLLVAKKLLASKKRKALSARNDAKVREWLTANLEKLSALPSPNERRAEKDETAADWANWMLTHAGMAGVKRAKKTAEALLR